MIDAECHDYQWKCDSGRCIYDQEYCDGYPHCDDGSDEPSGCSKLNFATVKMFVNADDLYLYIVKLPNKRVCMSHRYCDLKHIGGFVLYYMR